MIARAEAHSKRTAIIEAEGVFTYDHLLHASTCVASALLDGQLDLGEKRIPFLVTPGFPWAAVQWGIARAGGVAVPLPLGSPTAELEYFIDDTQAAALVTDAAGEKILAPIAAARGLRLLSWDEALAAKAQPLPEVEDNRRAMILYTSGTTSRPKGVVTTHRNMTAQITTLVHAWRWSADDRILLFLPLHHVHGLVNVVSCALWSGAVCEMLPRFDVDTATVTVGN